MPLLKFTPVPVSHTDGIGFLKDLANDVGESWFEMISDLAIANSDLDQSALDVLKALSKKTASYLPQRSSNTVASSGATSLAIDFLEELSGFSNFKLLSETLKMTFPKRITLTFGANGSGKSSICDCLKVLANSEPPTRPLYNVRGSKATAPAFCWKFNSDLTKQTWIEPIGYGKRKEAIKYFDTGIAIRNVKNPVEPGRLIELTPFKLDVFERAMLLTTKFREGLQQSVEQNSLELKPLIEAMRSDLARFARHPWTHSHEAAIAFLPEAIKLANTFADGVLLNQRRKAASELEKATSEAGLNLLKAEHHELQVFLASIRTLTYTADRLWSLQPVEKFQALAEKKTAQEVLARTLIPTNGDLDTLLKLLRAAAPLCKLENAAGHACPLCKRDLGKLEIELFRNYHNLLAGKLEADITALNREIRTAEELAKSIEEINREEWTKSATIPTEVVAVANASADLIIDSCDLRTVPSNEGRNALQLLTQSLLNWTEELRWKAVAIEVALADKHELLEQLEAVRSEIDTMEYYESLAERLNNLNESHRLAREVDDAWATIVGFPALQKKITDKAKQAHKELVVADFENRLNSEYRNLTDRDITAFGVKLRNVGDDAIVTLAPQIGNNQLEEVLSDGEQRTHALALFFAELETCSQSVVIFDDPISSFDYNYVANFCIRLRNFAIAHPLKQIIIFTHNWEFFVQMQTTINKGGLNPQFAVQILENCCEVAEYSEEVTQLKSEIASLLAIHGEPSRKQKEELAGNLRRLIEAIVNTHVFNHQRHQYKQKTQTVSNFQDFTRLVPLQQAEALTLRDLFEALSIPEHSDPRNAYVNTDKATFQARYDKIISVEAALLLRK